MFISTINENLQSKRSGKEARGRKGCRSQAGGSHLPEEPCLTTIQRPVGTKSWDQRQQNNTWGKYCHSDYGRTVPWHFRGAIVSVKLRDKAVL